MTVQITEFRAGLLGEYWNHFRERFIPEDAPAFQLDAMNSAYLAGCCAYSVAIAAAIKSGNGVREKTGAMWDQLDDELAAKLEAVSPDPIAVAESANVTITVDGKTITTEGGNTKTRVSVLDVRGLTDSDVTELGSLIEQFIGERKAAAKVAD